MRTRTKVMIGSAAVAAAAAVPAAANAAGDVDTPITGPALEQASRAALDHLGGGRVTGTEVGDEESYYEVEVTLEDGSAIDVQLDRNFAIVGSERDRMEPGDSEDG